MSKVFLLYPYYWPLYKAGGPVQSIVNFVSAFKGKADFYLVSHDHDIDGSQPSVKIEINRWTTGLNGEHIFYTSSLSPWRVINLIRAVKPDIIMVNGLFDLRTSLTGMLMARWMDLSLVISPRGMLQGWALKRNPILKKCILMLYRGIINGKNTSWHCTDQREVEDVAIHVGKSARRFLAPNIPRSISFRQQNPAWGKPVRLVFLSLLAPYKNLHLLLQALHQHRGSFILDIYGPIADQDYWEKKCQPLLEVNVSVYRGPVIPWEVPGVLSGYHFFVLPTKGENFGHAVFDALATGVPVLISNRTPWNGVASESAGLIFDPGVQDIVRCLSSVLAFNDSDYSSLVNGARKYALKYWKDRNVEEDYSFVLNHKRW